MPMRVNVTLPATSGLSADNVVNTFHLLAGAITPAAGEAITEAFQAFYLTFGTWINQSISRTLETEFKIYNLSEPEPRQPIYVNALTLPPAQEATSLPREVALCSSFSARVGSGQSAARRRGRVYMGPLVGGAAQSTGQPDPSMIDDLVEATENLVQNLAAIEGETHSLGVYSRVGNGISQVVRGWVDNEFDTQRRRGLKATSRSVWGVPGLGDGA